MTGRLWFLPELAAWALLQPVQGIQKFRNSGEVGSWRQVRCLDEYVEQMYEEMRVDMLMGTEPCSTLVFQGADGDEGSGCAEVVETLH